MRTPSPASAPLKFQSADVLNGLEQKREGGKKKVVTQELSK